MHGYTLLQAMLPRLSRITCQESSHSAGCVLGQLKHARTGRPDVLLGRVAAATIRKAPGRLVDGCVLAHAEAFTYLQYEMHCLTAMLVDQEKGFVCPSQGFRRQAFLARSQHGHSGFTQFDIDTRLGGLSRIRSSRPCLTSIASAFRSRVYLVLLE